MPTINEIDELLDKCTIERMMFNGVIGWKFTSKINGKCIFIPAAGFHWGGNLYTDGYQIRFWSSTRSPFYSYIAYDLDYYRGEGGYLEHGIMDRFCGSNIRPVVRK